MKIIIVKKKLDLVWLNCLFKVSWGFDINLKYKTISVINTH